MEWAAERYMNHVSFLDKNINVALAGVAFAKSKLDISGISYDSCSGGSGGDVIPDKLSALEKAVDDAESELVGYMEEMNQAKNALKAMDNEVYRAVLKCRYILKLDWLHTAQAIGYSESHAKSLRPPALIALYPHIPEEWKRNIPNAQT